MINTMQPFKIAQYEYVDIYWPGTSKLDADTWVRRGYSHKDLLEWARFGYNWRKKKNTLGQTYCSKQATNDWSEVDKEGEKIKDGDMSVQSVTYSPKVMVESDIVPYI